MLQQKLRMENPTYPLIVIVNNDYYDLYTSEITQISMLSLIGEKTKFTHYDQNGYGQALAKIFYI